MHPVQHIPGHALAEARERIRVSRSERHSRPPRNPWLDHAPRVGSRVGE